MGYSIAIANKKGGVGKSIITINLALMLAKKGLKTLIVDMDGQATTTKFLTEGLKEGVLNVLLGMDRTEDNIINITNNIDLLGATEELSNLSDRLSSHQILIGQESLLKTSLEGIKESYDYVLIDTPGVVDECTKNAIVAADYVLIPTILDGTAIDGTALMLELSRQIKRLNPKLQILGIVFNRFNPNSAILEKTKTAYQGLADEYGTKIFDSTIRQASVVGNSYTNSKDWTGQNIPIKKDFDNLVIELIQEINKKEEEK